MNRSGTKISRRQQILAALAKMLESSPGERITTAALANEVGVSEAALYRHFPSKTKMFEGLIEFIEETVFSRIAIILAEEKSISKRCENVLASLLFFAEKNPGMSRLLVGDALIGETERLRKRIAQFFDRLELQLKQILQSEASQKNLRFQIATDLHVHFLLAYIDGCITQYVRSEFQRPPLLNWQEQWPMFEQLLFPTSDQ